MGHNNSPEHALLERLRELCARLPETTEVETWGHPTFRVRDKIFASFALGEAGASIDCKQTHADQAVLVQAPRFSVARYVGRHGWVHIAADEVAWPMLEDLVLKSYRLIAPGPLAREV
jgi:predicted DNA-binding protein (MmcQ/YjbR family)